MHVIAVLNQKGGSTKTTIAVHLTRALQLMGHDVLLVDSDKQANASDWHAARDTPLFPVAGVSRPTLEHDIKHLRNEYIVIDGAPNTDLLAAQAIKSADFVLIPVQPSILDIWATAALVEMVKARAAVAGKPRAAFVVSRIDKRTRLSEKARTQLALFALPTLDTQITQRALYARIPETGLTVLDIPQFKDAAAEIWALAEEVKAHLHLNPLAHKD